LYSYSTVKGFYSYRNPESGSWFIQTLCDVIEKEKNEHILDILTQVNNLMSKKEIIVSTFETTLTKKFYFIQNINQQSENKLLFNNNKRYGKLNYANGYYKGELINNKINFNYKNRCFGRLLYKLSFADPVEFEVNTPDKVSKIRPAKEFRPLKNLLRE
jgi:hypothetical protein